MQTLLVVQRIIDSLRSPWIQRLITLVVSALLMMSLISTTIPLVLPQAGHAIASSVSGKLAEGTHRDEARIWGIIPMTHVRGH
jgi:hypothetical protein